MLQKILEAFQHRDASDEVGDGVIDLGAGTFGRRKTGNQCEVLLASGPKALVNAQGRECSRVGFAKVVCGQGNEGPPATVGRDGWCEQGRWSIPMKAVASDTWAGLMWTIKTWRGSRSLYPVVALGPQISFQREGLDQWHASWGERQAYGVVRWRVDLSLHPSL